MSKHDVVTDACIQFLFLICGFLLVWFLKNEFVIALGIILFLVLNFLIKYYRREYLVFIVGTAFGIVIEAGLSKIYKLQFWEQGSFFGIPIWLPLAWGYGFFFIRRIGNLIVRNH